MYETFSALKVFWAESLILLKWEIWRKSKKIINRSDFFLASGGYASINLLIAKLILER